MKAFKELEEDQEYGIAEFLVVVVYILLGIISIAS